MTFDRPASLRDRLQGARSGVRKRVYIGLDFGTTFAKVSYEIAPTTEHRKKSIRFSDGYYLPTVLYFDDGKLRFAQTADGVGTPVRYFKYSMVSDQLERTAALAAERDRLSIMPERLCSVHYLACLIRRVVRAICEREHIAEGGAQWSINMGMPVGRSKSPSPQVQPIYDEVLQVAWEWSQSRMFDETIELSALDTFYVTHQNVKNSRLHTVPELYAELSMYQQDRNVPEGFYSVVDVGGGTVDMAVFFKAIDRTNGVRIYCVAHEVSSEGMESVVSRIAASSDSQVCDKVRGCLLDPEVDFMKLGSLPVNDTRLSERSRRLVLSVQRFREAYGTCLRTAKSNKDREMREEIRNKGVLKFFVMGGGKSIHFHNQLLREMLLIQESAGVTHAEEGNIRAYLEASANFEVNDDRLLISQMLAQPFDNIPPLDGRPWEFKPAVKPRWSESPSSTGSLRDELEDRQRELYGDW